MRITTYLPGTLRESCGMEVGDVDLGAGAALGVAASWGRVAPGVASMPNQHDEIETWVVIAGDGELVVDAARYPVASGMVIQFDPFETHHVVNTGEIDLVFASIYWRDLERAAAVAAGVKRRRFGDRPVFVFSSAPTPNGDLHLGHLSGPFFGADVYVRFQRMLGVNAWHITGSDDYQSYVVAAARKEGRTPEATAAHYSTEILATLRLMDIEVHQYTATSREPGYPEALRRFFSRIADSPSVTLAEAPALVDEVTGAYLYEADVVGECPTCGEGTGGNICERCREPNFCYDLVAPESRLSAATPRTQSLARYMLALHERHAEVIAHHRLGRVPASVKELAGLVFRRGRLDVALTHPAQWGIAPAEPGVDGQVIWAWIDLAFNFLFSIEELGRQLGHDWRADAPQADWKIVHFLGSDGTFYHPLFMPVLYRLAYPDWQPDIDYNLNEFYQLEGAKFSTSRGHAIWGKDILNARTVDAIRCYLALTRPEGRRTNFALSDFEDFVREKLIGSWQRWLSDLGARIDKLYGGIAPDAGLWTPEQTAFIARLGNRLSEVTTSLGQDGFSLNQAAAALDGIVTDTVRFSRQESPADAVLTWRDEARTAIALELAAARLLAACAAPVMPRFATRLSAALGLTPPSRWPRCVELLSPGTLVTLAGQEFFAGTAPTTPTATAAQESLPLLPWLSEMVRATLRLPTGTPVHDQTLVALGMESLQVIALQYQLAERADVDVSMEDLLGSRTVAELAGLIADGMAPEAVAAHAGEVRG